MEKEIFKKGDRVFHWDYGWGTVNLVNEDSVKVRFNNSYELFDSKGRWTADEPPSLSFTEYDFINGRFSQERPNPDLKDKWECVFTLDKKRAVRNKSGLICVFNEPSRYNGQDERYERELEEVRKNQKLTTAAPDLLNACMMAKIEIEKATADNLTVSVLEKAIQKALG